MPRLLQNGAAAPQTHLTKTQLWQKYSLARTLCVGCVAPCFTFCNTHCASTALLLRERYGGVQNHNSSKHIKPATELQPTHAKHAGAMLQHELQTQPCSKHRARSKKPAARPLHANLAGCLSVCLPLRLFEISSQHFAQIPTARRNAEQKLASNPNNVPHNFGPCLLRGPLP